jgi:hypothetical protein
MTRLNSRKSRAHHVAGSILVLLLATAGSMALPGAAAAQADPIPEQIKKLDMGASTAKVLDTIGGIGTHTSEDLPKESASRVVWNLPNNPYYKHIDFEFTQKDRLFLVRFLLNDSARQEYHSLKKTVFKDYDFSWEKPMKLRVKDRDIVAYGPEKGMALYFFEFTDKKTHEKSFELFSRSVRSTDRQPAESKEKTDALDQAGQADKKPDSADTVREGAKSQESSQSGEASESKPTEKREIAPKPEENVKPGSEGKAEK